MGAYSLSAGMIGTSFIAEPVPENNPIALTVSGRFTSAGAPLPAHDNADVLIGGSAVDGMATVKLEMSCEADRYPNRLRICAAEMMPWPMDARRMTHVVGRAWQTNDGQPNQ